MEKMKLKQTNASAFLTAATPNSCNCLMNIPGYSIHLWSLSTCFHRTFSS